MRRRKLLSKDLKTSHEYIELNCTNCGAPTEVESIVTGVICWRCTVHYGPTPVEKVIQEPTGFPKGWKFFKQFVHTDGRVFERGVENESLKGTLPVTVIVAKPKLTRREKELKKIEKEKKLATKYERKMEKKKKQERKKEKKQQEKQKEIEKESHVEQFFE